MQTGGSKKALWGLFLEESGWNNYLIVSSDIRVKRCLSGEAFRVTFFH